MPEVTLWPSHLFSVVSHIKCGGLGNVGHGSLLDLTTALKALSEREELHFSEKPCYLKTLKGRKPVLEGSLTVTPHHHQFKENYDSRFEPVPNERETFQEVLLERKGPAFPRHRANSISSLNDPLLKTKLCFGRGKKKKNCVLLFGLIFPIHLTHSYIHSGDSSRRLRKGLHCHWPRLKLSRFLCLHPLGPLLLLQ